MAPGERPPAPAPPSPAVKQGSAPKRLRPSVPPRPGTYRADFIDILSNRGKQDGDPGARERGFVVFAREAPTLQPLQAACFEQSYNRCLTARYRLSEGLQFGTLLSALAHDLDLLRTARGGSPPSIGGDILPPVTSGISGTPWERLFTGPVGELLEDKRSRGVLEGHAVDRDWITAFFDALADESTLGVGSRFIVFCEIAAKPGPEEDWRAALEVLQTLPERVGFVLSNPPPKLALPPEDPHYLDLSMSGVTIAGGEVRYRYADTALSGDQAADHDHLEVSSFADGLARLVLLQETRPLTIGIHAPWGGGKSSFMNFVHHALIKNVTGEKVRGSVWQRFDTSVSEQADQPERFRRFTLGLRARTLMARAGTKQGQAALAYFPLETIERSLAKLDDADPAELATDKDHRAVAEKRRQLEANRERLLRTLETVAARRVVSVHFDAWRYENATQIWAGLAHDITAALERTMPWRARLGSRFLYAVTRRPGEFWMGFVLPVVAALVIAGLIAAAGVELGEEAGGGDHEWLSKLIPGGSIVLALLFAARRFHSVAQKVSDRVLAFLAAPDYRGDTGYQHRVIDDLTFLRGRMQRRRLRIRGWRPQLVRETPRIVVFIDNLDRCSDEHVVEILQAINLTLGASEFYVFLGMDTEMVHNGIARHYGFDDGIHDPGRAFAENYLRKIIQLSFHLPRTNPEARLNFISRLFSVDARRDFQAQTTGAGANSDGAAAPFEDGGAEGAAGTAASTFRVARAGLASPKVQVLKEVRDTGEELRAFESLREFISQNPRELKRLVNVHRLVKILLQRPETPPSDAEQRQLVSWLVFCARWPELVDDMLDRAREHPLDSDCLSMVTATVSDDEALEGFVALVKKQGFGGQALQPGSLLESAARISRSCGSRLPVGATEPPA